MINTELGDLTYNTGWKTSLTVTIFGKRYNIIVKAKAYFEEDGITEAQKKSITVFSTNMETILKKVMTQLENYDANCKKRFAPRMLLFKRDGSSALLFDDSEYPDEGIAACFFPDYCIISQDEYL